MLVGFIGLGMMGLRMAKRLLNKGIQLVVWNRSKEKIEQLREFNIEVASTPKELAKKTKVILLMLSDENACDEVIFGENGILDGLSEDKDLTIVNFSTISPTYSINLERSLKSVSVKYVEVPVLGSLKEAEEGRLLALIGGDKETVDGLSPILDILAGKCVYIGNVGRASALKLTVNALSLTIVSLFCEVLTLARSWGVDVTTVYDVLKETWLKAVVEKYGNRVLSDNIPPRFKVELAKKDLFYALKSGYEKDIPLLIISSAMQVYTNATKYKDPSKDYTRNVYKYYSRLL